MGGPATHPSDRQQLSLGLGQLAAALDGNRRQLQRNLAAAAARLPFASVAASGRQPTQQQPQQQAKQQQQQQQQQAKQGWGLCGGSPAAAAAAPPASIAAAAAATAAAGGAELVCIEFTRDRRRVYRRQPGAVDSSPDSRPAEATGGKGRRRSKDVRSRGADGSRKRSTAGGWEITDDAVRGRQRLGDLVSDYLLPQGYPHSVGPEYSSYMFWRGVQYFFGGAMSVFTTKSLLASLGVSNKRTGEAAAAINWVVKDGAGRLGRFLFARWGRELDCELKQFRLAGDALMESGAALELSTVLMPRWFLPLACTANLAKNLAAVAASSTRAPIYRTFAKANNLADVTAKGESVANLADVVGTAAGIALAKFNLPVLPTFCILSLGYLYSSRREVDSVVLPYLNRARLSYAARAFLSTGEVPGLVEGNAREPLMPWSDPHNGRVVLGATVEEACAGPGQLKEALSRFAGRQYALTYRPDSRKCYVLLKQGATPPSVVQAALDAHCLLWMLDQQKAAGSSASSAPAAAAPATGSQKQQRRRQSVSSTTSGSSKGGPLAQLHAAASSPGAAPGSAAAAEAALQFVAGSGGRQLCQLFEKEATAGGWRMNMTMLNPKETRLVVS